MILRGDYVTIRPIEACALFHLSEYTEALDAYKTYELNTARIRHIGTVAGHMMSLIASNQAAMEHHDFGQRGIVIVGDTHHSLSSFYGIEDLPRLEIPLFAHHCFHETYDYPDWYFQLEQTPRNGCYINRFTNTAPPHTRSVYKARSDI